MSAAVYIVAVLAFVPFHFNHYFFEAATDVAFPYSKVCNFPLLLYKEALSIGCDTQSLAL